jgi:hypothetical protein
MHDDKPDQFVDELLEAALKRYGGEGPSAGLEMRVLAGVLSRQGAARRLRLVWALAACAGILAAIVLVLHSARAPRREPVISASAPRQAAKPAASSGSAGSRSASPRLVQGPREKPRTPKPGVLATKPSRPEQFPTPMPLTEQEKLLLTYFANTTKPDLLAETNKAEGAAEISNIKVAPLEIEPLDDSESGQGK